MNRNSRTNEKYNRPDSSVHRPDRGGILSFNLNYVFIILQLTSSHVDYKVFTRDLKDIGDPKKTRKIQNLLVERFK